MRGHQTEGMTGGFKSGGAHLPPLDVHVPLLDLPLELLQLLLQPLLALTLALRLITLEVDRAIQLGHRRVQLCTLRLKRLHSLRQLANVRAHLLALQAAAHADISTTPRKR